MLGITPQLALTKCARMQAVAVHCRELPQCHRGDLHGAACSCAANVLRAEDAACASAAPIACSVCCKHRRSTATACVVHCMHSYGLYCALQAQPRPTLVQGHEWWHPHPARRLHEPAHGSGANSASARTPVANSRRPQRACLPPAPSPPSLLQPTPAADLQAARTPCCPATCQHCAPATAIWSSSWAARLQPPRLC
jgi:hypothetical protein